MRRWPRQPHLTLAETMTILAPDDAAEYMRIRNLAIAERRDFRTLFRVARGDGTEGWEDSIGHPRFDEAGNLVGVLAVVRDVTEEKQAADTLAERERHLAAIMDNAPFAIFLKDRDGRYLRTNRLFDKIAGKSEQPTTGGRAPETIVDDWIEIAMRTDEEVMSTGKILTIDTRTYAKRDDFQYASVTKFPVRDDTGEIVGVGGIIANITERHLAEQTLRQREADLRAIMNNAPVAIFLKDRAGRFRFVNRRYVEWYHFDPDRIYGRSNADILPVPLRYRADDTDREVLARGEIATFEYRTDWMDHKDGFDVARVTKFRIVDEAGDIVGVGGFVEDITARKGAEEALRKSEERFRALIEQSNDLTIVVEGGVARYVSPSVWEQAGYAAEEIIGQSIFDFVHPDDRDDMIATYQTVADSPGQRESGRVRLRQKDGTWRVIAWSARNATDVSSVGGIIINGRDITAAKKLEEQLLQAQKMEAVGQLAGGIAHDFNNMISVIMGFARFLLEDLPKESPQHEYAASIAHAADRAREVVRQILAFSRRSKVERSLNDIGAILHETRGLLRAGLPPAARFHLAVDGEGLLAQVNKGEIHQVLQNLCVNASDALGGSAGEVSIKASRVTPGDPDYDQFGQVGATGSAVPADGAAQNMVGILDRATPYVRIAVSDTGGGIPPDVMRRLFEPFFTTKQRGQGTGLGLAVVHGIIASYHGACRIESRLGGGTTVSVYLPLARGARTAEASAEKAPEVRGKERVLVIDDEPDVAEVLVIGLGRLGYAVTAFNDPVAAVASFEDSPNAWDVVVCDQIMPRLDGFAVLARVRAIRATLPFILCTGFASVTTEEQAAALGVDDFFIKPVSPERLGASIRALSGASEPASA
jgi:PAS domain S-box-containing protein